MNLLELYSLATGLKIKDQFLLEQFYPLPFSKYITVHASSGMAGKNYNHYSEVLNLLKPHLDAQGISIVQIGGKDDIELTHAFQTKGKTSIAQGNYILSRALLHLGNDSCWCHRAGHVKVPLVALFGPTHPLNHGPLNPDRSKTTLIESHRWNRKPTFAAQEQQSTISVIPPEQVANAVLNLLGIPHQYTYQTLAIGPMYYSSMLELIPNCPIDAQFNPSVPLTVRMDLEFNEQILYQIFQSGRKIHVFTAQPINPQLLAAFKDSILSYTHELFETCPASYIKQIKAIFPGAVFFSRETHEDALSRLRFKFFDTCVIQQATEITKTHFLNMLAEYTNKPVDSLPQIDKMEFKTNKFVLSKGKIYLSHAHANADIPISNGITVGKIIDSPEFWRDSMHLMVINPK